MGTLASNGVLVGRKQLIPKAFSHDKTFAISTMSWLKQMPNKK
jgi:hypothetical protein